jgi:hypothetical protein
MRGRNLQMGRREPTVPRKGTQDRIMWPTAGTSLWFAIRLWLSHDARTLLGLHITSHIPGSINRLFEVKFIAQFSARIRQFPVCCIWIIFRWVHSNIHDVTGTYYPNGKSIETAAILGHSTISEETSYHGLTTVDPATQPAPNRLTSLELAT